MDVVLQQLPALLGVVIGALGSYLALVRSDQARFRREEAARWEERRLAVYSDYARSVKKTVTVTYRVAAALGCGTHPDPLALDEAKPLLAEANEGRDPAGEALLMLGSVDVVEKARSWVVTVMEMERFVREGRPDTEAWQALLDRQRAGREGYYTAVREDLGLPPGHSARWRLPVTVPAPDQR
ncbi:hypothetical protein Stsp02_30840 [Streptomyces sp. NBRC 14336]|uniref:hypothetical protein n=1 Tax=Streptomyces sp. NBRC 14336 TaxID=3030992 RepID=UPI0024A2D873|nr:hypothetical protein [Streptomyces sp. NBRC 14336]GLW47422.1 hypothetical protein Stsp02_30840 [Streptomyces sp. NBRC 14336]